VFGHVIFFDICYIFGRELNDTFTKLT